MLGNRSRPARRARPGRWKGPVRSASDSTSCTSASGAPAGRRARRRPGRGGAGSPHEPAQGAVGDDVRAASREVRGRRSNADPEPSPGAADGNEARRGGDVLRRAALLALGSLAAGLTPRATQAHEIRPGFLELRETAPETYSVLWKHPAGGEVQISIAPVFPEGCSFRTSDRQQMTPGAVIVRGTLRCQDGIGGKTIAIAGLEATITDVLIRLHNSRRAPRVAPRPAHLALGDAGRHDDHRPARRRPTCSSGSSTSSSAWTTCSSSWACC